ncbi:TetR/AcrR family transcriptional regulator [Thermosynechococcaceae cyanobacterium BACA0444]|uniref:TetR/AcrR family transcriptional regulator n=1 Tax=Pseudocalidococcus azoricus BACA0444 TaxID=2918990 RepID=A0AAE4FS19_9CYAN|nr:TetR/AcrR family transcriptional regulator [Pseudocalidococcus azoricus]MDS3860252.1 TetR/AcrR family transcriptional regulator [Pseudocalidococcus azoricus BACA0444]
MTPSPASDKAEQILTGAMQAFLAQGYAGTSMDRVAAAAGVSKATVYSHFQDKERLFQALVRRMAKRKFSEVFTDMDDPKLEGDPLVVFPAMGRTIMARMLADSEHLDFMRMVIGESGRFPQLAKACIQNLTKYSLEFLTQYIAAHPEFGVPDPEATARIVLGAMVFFVLSQKAMYGEEIIPMDEQRMIDAMAFLLFRDQ